MIWYKYLYLGETAKKHRFSILQKLRLGKVQPGVHVITPASGGHNLLDILPAYVLRQNYYRLTQAGYLGGEVTDTILDSQMDVLADVFNGRIVIVDETYRETGGFDVKTYLREKEDRLRKKR